MDFHEAVRCNNLELLRQWAPDALKQAINEPQDDLTPLEIAVKNNRIDIAKFLLSNGAALRKMPQRSTSETLSDITCKNARSCLQHACDRLNFDLVRCLVDYGAMSEMNKWEKQCLGDVLFVAVQRNDQAMVQFLAEHGIDLNYRGDNGWTPLVQAISFQNKEMVSHLLTLGAKADVLDCNDMNALHHVVKFKGEKSQEIIDLLQESQQSLINAKDEDGCTPLWYAVESCNIEAVKKLLNLGASLEENFDEIDPTELACKTGSKDLVELFLSMGVYQADKSTPLGFAAVKGDLDCMEILCNSTYGDAWLSSNADPLYDALLQPSKDHANVRYLLQKGIVLHKISQDKNPLKAAVENKDETSLMLLFSFGFDWRNISLKARSEIEQILVRHQAISVATSMWKNGYQFQPVENTRSEVEAYLHTWPRIYIDPIKDDIIKALANLDILEQSVLPLQSLTVVYLRRYLYSTAVIPGKFSMSDIVEKLALPNTVQELICDAKFGMTSITSNRDHKDHSHPNDSGNVDCTDESDLDSDNMSDCEAEYLKYSDHFANRYFTEKGDENSIDVERFRSFSRKSTKELIGDINFDSTDDEEV